MSSLGNVRGSLFSGDPALLYVAFIDILGFSQRVENDFSFALKLYDDLFRDLYLVRALQAQPNVSIQVVSDAFIIKSERLDSLAFVVQALLGVTMIRDILVRGGIGYGRHVESSDDKNHYVVSEALVQAAHLEKTVRHPCVAVCEHIVVPSRAWQPTHGRFSRSLLYFEGIRIINPFNLMWGESAMRRVVQLSERFPEQREKHEWFFRLYKAIVSGDPLAPPV